MHAWCCCISMLTVSTSPSTDFASDRYDSAVDSHTSKELTVSEMPSDVTKSTTSEFFSCLCHEAQHCSYSQRLHSSFTF